MKHSFNFKTINDDHHLSFTADGLKSHWRFYNKGILSIPVLFYHTRSLRLSKQPCCQRSFWWLSLSWGTQVDCARRRSGRMVIAAGEPAVYHCWACLWWFCWSLLPSLQHTQEHLSQCLKLCSWDQFLGKSLETDLSSLVTLTTIFFFIIIKITSELKIF